MNNEWKRFGVQVAGLAIIVTAFVSLLGELLNVKSVSNWGFSDPMPVPTAIMFIVVGTVFMIMGRENNNHNN